MTGPFQRSTRLLYTGREWDAETGLYFNRARYYDPGLGRFVSSDPKGYAAGLNLYTYTRNNPLSFRDPEGMDVYWGGWAGALFGGIIGFFSGMFSSAASMLSSAASAVSSAMSSAFSWAGSAMSSAASAVGGAVLSAAEISASIIESMRSAMSGGNNPQPPGGGPVKNDNESTLPSSGSISEKLMDGILNFATVAKNQFYGQETLSRLSFANFGNGLENEPLITKTLSLAKKFDFRYFTFQGLNASLQDVGSVSLGIKITGPVDSEALVNNVLAGPLGLSAAHPTSAIVDFVGGLSIPRMSIEVGRTGMSGGNKFNLGLISISPLVVNSNGNVSSSVSMNAGFESQGFKFNIASGGFSIMRKRS